MSENFNQWWNNDLLTEDNPFVDSTPAYWAWEGWCAGVKVENEACALIADEAEPYNAADLIRKRMKK